MSSLSRPIQSIADDPVDSLSEIQHPTPTPNPAGVRHVFGRQLRGVANFLAPPPTSPSSSAAAECEKPPLPSRSSSSSQALIGMRNDLAEFGGSLKSGLFKFTSSFLQFQNTNINKESKGEHDDYVPGITEEVVAFVKEISSRPECWIDFPLSLENYDFRMSDAQKEHALAVEHLVPTFKDLRKSLNSYMVDGQFWMVYFIVLLPRLNEHDLKILSTPQIVETRNMVLQKLKNKGNVKAESFGNSKSLDTSQDSNEVSDTQNNISSKENNVSEIVKATEQLKIDNEENNCRWFEDTDVDVGTSMDNRSLGHEEDVSFSDVEDDDNDLSSTLPTYMQAQSDRASSPSGSSGWVQLIEGSDTQGGSQRIRQSSSFDKDSDGDSNDWHKVDEFYLTSE